MLAEFNNHFILISGESGAGKTEASKKILQYYAVSCPSTALLNTVRDKMLMSNPVLEVWLFQCYIIVMTNQKGHANIHLWLCCFAQAFGNAKTLKNDNSSRFGKYMDIQFDSEVKVRWQIHRSVSKKYISESQMRKKKIWTFMRGAYLLLFLKK